MKNDIIIGHTTTADDWGTLQSRPVGQPFPFHLLARSPWPILSSLGAFNMLGTIVLWFHHVPTSYFLLLNFISLSLGLILWFGDVTIEATQEGDHSVLVASGLTKGYFLFLSTEVMLFLSFFWTFFHASLAPSIEVGLSWPPVGITPIDPYELPFLNTLLLLSSGAAATLSHHLWIGGAKKGAVVYLATGIVLGVAFCALQGVEYSTSPFTIADSVYGNVFYTLTGLHGFHVIIGTIFLCVSLYKYMTSVFTTQTHLGLEYSLVYWHFVDLIWLFVLLFIYIWSA